MSTTTLLAIIASSWGIAMALSVGAYLVLLAYAFILILVRLLDKICVAIWRAEPEPGSPAAQDAAKIAKHPTP